MIPEPPICCITHPSDDAGSVLRTVEDALAGGVRWVQLRRPGAPTRPLLDLARRLREITAAAGASLFVNDRLDIALAVGSDGVHLPVAGLPVVAVRRAAHSLRIGCSVHSLEEITHAARAAADYFQFGPVFETASKPRPTRPQGLGALARAVEAAGQRPVVAVGGIDAVRAREALLAGAAGVAVIGALHRAADRRAAATELVAALDRS